MPTVRFRRDEKQDYHVLVNGELAAWIVYDFPQTPSPYTCCWCLRYGDQEQAFGYLADAKAAAVQLWGEV